MLKATTKTTKSKAAPKSAKTVAGSTKTKTKTEPKAVKKPKAEAKPKAPAKPKTPAKPKAPAKPAQGVIKQTADAISQLASDILADRIVPTIEQIKSIAASALSQDQAKGKRPKKKK